MMAKTLISVLIALVIGFFSNRLFSNFVVLDKDNDSLNVKCAELTQAKSNLISLSQNEYLEYTQIKDLKQKYEKADELLGKVMLLFLADVGFKIHSEVPTEPSVNKTDGHPSQSPPIAEIKAPSDIVEQPQGATSLAGRSALLKTLSTEKQIQDVLDGAIIENPKMEIAKGGIPTQKQAKILEGKYLGYVRFLDGKRENLSVIWDLQPDYSKSRLSGMFHLSIHGPGQDSESNGRGDIDSIVSLAADKDGFLVNACGDRCYLQLYYNSSADEFFGNYYEIPKGSLSSKPARLGIIALKK